MGIGRILRRMMGGGAPLSDAALREDARTRCAQLFDAPFYLAQLKEPPGAGVNPLDHYLDIGWRDGHDPSPLFSTSGYLNANPDVAAANMNPLGHYVASGWREGRIWREIAATPASREIRKASDLDPQTRAQCEALFDAAYYRAQVGAEAIGAASPLDHYFAHWRDNGATPMRGFDPQFYLARNPDIAASGEDPFAHYASSGRNEKRPGAHPIGWRAKALADILPPEERRKLWLSGAPMTFMPTDQLRARLDASTASGRPLALAFSHDNYLENVGGLQSCVAVEEKAFAARGVVYLQASPAQPLPTLADAAEPEKFPLMLTLDGAPLGRAMIGDLARALAPRPPFVAIVHSLLGYDLDALRLTLAIAPMAERYLWAHDYFPICPGYNLMRNDLVFCGAPDAASAACGVCVYGDERRRTAAPIADFLADGGFRFIAPSEAAACIYRERAPFPVGDIIVAPHLELSNERRTHDVAALATREGADAPIRLAFLGYPTAAKGWPLFRAAMERFIDDPRYEFHHFGSQPFQSGAKFHSVRVTRDNQNAMVDALVAAGIDACLVLSLWPETFCITAHEAIAAGAALVAHRDGGAAARLAGSVADGFVVAGEEDLMTLLDDNRLRPIAITRRREGRRIAEISFRAMTAGVAGEGGPGRLKESARA